MRDVSEPRMLRSESGGTIALHKLGTEGPPLLFVHATGFNARTYGPFMAELTKHFTVWAPDLRAHGWSSPPEDDDYEWTSLAEDILVVVDHLEIATGELNCVGHSVGAATLLLADAARPGLIRRMYGYEPVMWRPGEAFPAGENPLIPGAMKRREVFNSRAEALERFASRPPFASCRADALHSYVMNIFEDIEAGGVRLRCRGANEAKIYDGERVSTTDKVVACEAPIVIGKGRSPSFEALGVPEAGLPAAEALPNARIIYYEGLTHFGPLEAPEKVAVDALLAVQ